jgi:uncharacterized membrane protein YfcA
MDMFAAINPLLVVSGFVVGMLVGLTGVGGGSLMTPILVLLFGVHATTAVGTDLLYAAITKTGGTLTHGLKGTVDWRVTGRLAAGSIPATILTLFALYILGIKGNDSPPLITTALGIALVMTAVCVLSHRWLRLLTATRRAEPDPQWTAALTTFAGLLLGVFVTLSSVGAGAIGMTALVLLYPRTPIARLVGSDIAHAVPLTLIAGVGHWLLGSVDWVLLGSLVIGSLPHLLRQPSECAGAGQGVAAGPRDNPRHRWRAHAASLSIAKLVFGAEKASRDQAGRAPRWRLLEAR